MRRFLVGTIIVLFGAFCFLMGTAFAAEPSPPDAPQVSKPVAPLSPIMFGSESAMAGKLVAAREFGEAVAFSLAAKSGPGASSTESRSGMVDGVSPDNAPGPVSSGVPNADHWNAIASCEGNDWGYVGQTFSGHLGIANSSWLEAGGGQYGPTAGHATPEQQMAVANVIYSRYGPNAWGCRAP